MKLSKIAFLLILVLGLILRLYSLGSIPGGFFRDEAALGYNAYSIWTTGKDEYGVSYPLVFRSFEVFFLPLYAYLSAPIVGIFGLNEATSRMVSSLSGIFALFVVYFLGKEFLGKKAAMFAMLLLAISPWHIFYSRGAFEGNLGMALFASGFLFWLYFLKSHKARYFLLSTLLFSLSMYSYQSERLVVPFFALVVISLSNKLLWKFKNKLVIPSLAILVILIPLATLSFKAGGYHRAFGVSIFAKDEEPPGWISGVNEGFLLNNTPLLRGKQFAALYLSYFSPRNLFIEGDYEKQRSTENFSVLYSLVLPMMIVGLWTVLKRNSRQDKLLITWILLAPIPAALTGDPFHTYRSLMLYLPLTLLAGIGAGHVWQEFRFGKVFLGLFTITCSINLILFIYNYAVITKAARARDWDWGYKEMVEFLNSMPEEKKIIVDDPATEAYIHILFYGKVDPAVYQQEVKAFGDPATYYYNNPSEIRPGRVGRFEFRDVNWAEVRGDKDSIFVFTPQELPESEFVNDPNVSLLKEIKYPDGKIAYRIVAID